MENEKLVFDTKFDDFLRHDETDPAVENEAPDVTPRGEQNARQLRDRIPNPMLDAATRELKQMRRETIRHCRDQLHLHLGAIVEDERVVADTATIFLAMPDRRLQSVATVNLNRDRLVIYYDDHGIVPAVARTRQDRLVEDVNKDVDYFEDVNLTRSEAAIQIESFDGDLAGIVNLEFRRPCTLEELYRVRGCVQEHMAELAGHLLVLQSLRRFDDDPLCWHPDLHGWSLEAMLDRLCHRLSQSIDRDLTKTTIWCGDIAKDEAHVYATSGGAFTYKCERTLSLSDTVLGRKIACAMAEVVPYDPADDLVARGVQTGLSPTEGWLYAFRPDCARATFDSGHVALLVMFTGRDCECVEQSRREIVQEALPLLARWLEDGLNRFYALRGKLISTQLLYRLSMGKKRNFEQLLQAALQSLSASGGSLFAIPRRSRQLECVATTGLVKNPDSDIWAHDHLAYDMDREVSPTVVVACDNRRPLRLNRLGDVAEQYDQGLPDCRSKFMETLLDDDCERGRRFLAASMMIDREPLGVLRVVRSAAEKPFTAADEDLIAQLAEIGALLVCQWRQGKRAESRPRAVRDVECCTETN